MVKLWVAQLFSEKVVGGTDDLFLATREAIQEDDDGMLEASIADLVARAKRKRAALRASGAIHLGMMRHLYLVIDSSECMSLQDLKPTRFLCLLKLLETFVSEFFDLNPISQLGILSTKKKRCDKVTELAGNPKKHIEVSQLNFFPRIIASYVSV